MPSVRLLYGLAFPVERAAVVRFEAKWENWEWEHHGPPQPDRPGMSGPERWRRRGHRARGRDRRAGRRGALAVAGRSLAAAVDPFAHPEVRDWLSFTPEPEHRAEHGPCRRGGDPGRESGPARPFVRPLSGASEPELRATSTRRSSRTGRFPAGAVELTATVSHLFEPGRIETILHLLGDSRPISGAGESRFTRGAIWFVPLTAPAENGSP